MQDALISLQDITKQFFASRVLISDVLKGISFDISSGEYVAIMGPSGSGKSTLLSIMGGIERPTSGKYRINEQDVYALSDAKIASLRCHTMGFVFQGYNLLARHTAIQNVMLPMYYAGTIDDKRARAEMLLERVGLKDHMRKYPIQMSGGMQQRVAIARALANAPTLILADEPTGNLDSATSRDILKLFGELNEEGITMVMVTHNAEVAHHAKRLIVCIDGAIRHDGTIQEGLRLFE